MSTPLMVFGQGGGNDLFEANQGFTDDGVAYVLRGRSVRVAPAGPEGECIFPAVYLAISHTMAVTLKVLPVVDDVELDPVMLTLTAKTSRTLERFEIGLSVAQLDALGVERGRVAPSGCWFQLLVNSGAGLLGLAGLLEEEFVASNGTALQGFNGWSDTAGSFQIQSNRARHIEQGFETARTWAQRTVTGSGADAILEVLADVKLPAVFDPTQEVGIGCWNAVIGANFSGIRVLFEPDSGTHGTLRIRRYNDSLNEVQQASVGDVGWATNTEKRLRLVATADRIVGQIQRSGGGPVEAEVVLDLNPVYTTTRTDVVSITAWPNIAAAWDYEFERVLVNSYEDEEDPLAGGDLLIEESKVEFEPVETTVVAVGP